MIIAKAPLRISFLGGGTDYPAYFSQYGGATLAASINKYNIITVNRITQFAEYKLRVHYSQVESVKYIDEIKHPSARECLRFLGFKEGIEIHYLSDLPARTGLGSSSTATAGLLTALHAFKGEKAGQEQIAAEAVYVEQELIKENVGCQDQYICALGGLMHLEFQQDKKVNLRRITLSQSRLKELEERLMLFYTGMQRDAHTILFEQIKRTSSGENNEYLERLKMLVGEGVKLLAKDKKISDFVALLHEGWMLKCRLSSKVTTPFVDQAYAKARRAGALGGKLLGAGGGGFLLLFVEPPNQEEVRQELSGLYETKFSFEHSGTQVIFNLA